MTPADRPFPAERRRDATAPPTPGGAEAAGTAATTGATDVAGAASATGRADGRPRLRPGVRMAHDPARGADVVLLPEGVLILNETAAAVLALCDGTRDVQAIVTRLGTRFDGVRRADVADLMVRLLRRRVVTVDD